ncbi:hypothetical protein [Brucella intermedia]|uniref:hypothetical protein n=1 Tax=Brucella intermedia TaxID=94625 RepID=UPI00224B0DD3|nr:hypothetical protein [Brucella intermedia]
MASELKPWRYEIKYGPEGEDAYSWVYDDHGAMVATMKTHKAKQIVDAMNTRPAPAATDTGLERFGQDWHDEMVPNKDGDYVLYSQAVELLAAERVKYEAIVDSLRIQLDRVNALEADNEELSAEKQRMLNAMSDMSNTNKKLSERIKELEAALDSDPDGSGLWRFWSKKSIEANQQLRDKTKTIEALEAKLAAAEKDRLPEGHVIIEQADMTDAQGRVSQTVQVTATEEEYERIVHVREAYGEDDNEYAR